MGPNYSVALRDDKYIYIECVDLGILTTTPRPCFYLTGAFVMMTNAKVSPVETGPASAVMFLPDRCFCHDD